MSNENNIKETTRELKVVQIPQGKTYVPGFRIAGKWLKNAGFDYNDTALITQNEDGSLNITKI